MTPSKLEKTGQSDLFLASLSRILNRRHALYALADAIDWDVFDAEFGGLYVDGVGRPGVATRLMVGIHYLKHAFNVSDEDAVLGFLENPYWQYFCGMEHFVHECPFDRSSMTRWRHRIGAEKMERLLKETFETAKRGKLITPSETKRVIVDTTVQEKAIAFPTDARLYFKATRALVRAAEQVEIPLRQSYVHVSKLALLKQGRYAHARQMNRAKRETKRLRTYLGRVIRDIGRKQPKNAGSEYDRLNTLLKIAGRIHVQKREDHGKIYSIHAPEVECIAKGKAHKKYEFGCKVSVATTAKSSWIVGIKAMHGNPFDGHTLKAAIDQVTRIMGHRPQEAFVDKGYKGAANHPEDVKVHVAGTSRGKTRGERKWLKRRSAVEPIIGHTKADNRMDRNFLAGQMGDEINAILAGSGRNLRKLLKELSFVFLRSLLRALQMVLVPTLQSNPA